MTIDHVVPKWLGGGEEDDNLVPACSTCNGAKGHKSIEAYREECQAKKKHLPKGHPNKGIGYWRFGYELWKEGYGWDGMKRPKR